MASETVKKVYSEVETNAKTKVQPKKYYWNDVCMGFNHSGLTEYKYVSTIAEINNWFCKLNDFQEYLHQYNTLYTKYFSILFNQNSFTELKTKKGTIKRQKRNKTWTTSQLESMATQNAKTDFYESIADPEKKELIELYFSAITYLHSYRNLSITELETQKASNTITRFVTKANVTDELKKHHIIFGEDNPGNNGTGECERLTIETQNKITDKMNSILPSAQEKIENGTPTSSFESSVDTAKTKKEQEDLQKAFGMGGSNEQDSLQVDTAQLSQQIQSAIDLPNSTTLTEVQASDPDATELLRGKQLAAQKTNALANFTTATDKYDNLTTEKDAYLDDLMDANDNHPGLAKAILNNYNFTSETSDYTIATDEEVANKEAYLAANKAISEAKTQMFQEGLGCATNIASNVIDLAFQGTAAWAQCKSLYSKEGLKEIWEEIQDSTWGTLKTYGKQKVADLQQEIIKLPIEATSYAVTRISYYTSYFTTEIMKEVNLSKIMTTEEIKRTSKANVIKAQEKQETVEKSLGKVQETVSYINAEVNKISGFIASGMSYAVEAPSILIKYLDNIMDMGFSYTDKYFDLAIDKAENFIYKEIDISSKAIGNFAAARIVAPLKVQLQDTMSQINITKAKAIVKGAASIATAISKIAAQLGL